MILHYVLRRLPALLFLLICAAPAAGEVKGTVTRVHDGDTLVVAGVGTVRLLGIDSPEMEASERDLFYRRRGIAPETLRRVARQALAFNLRHVRGRTAVLTFDDERIDRHGRTLAFLTLPDGRMLNRLLLEEGLAAVYRRFDFRLKESFLAAERVARRAGRGIWARSSSSSMAVKSSDVAFGGLPIALRGIIGAQ